MALNRASFIFSKKSISLTISDEISPIVSVFEQTFNALSDKCFFFYILRFKYHTMKNIYNRLIFAVLVCTSYLFIVYCVLFLQNGQEIEYTLFQLAGLSGFLSLAIAVILNLFRSQMRQILGKPFLWVHHLFAFSGLFLITLHPLLLTIQTSTASVFIPIFSSFYLTLANGGRIALLFLYIAVAAALLRKHNLRGWIILHRFTYPALILGIIHANLMGTTFDLLQIKLFFNSVAIFILLTGFSVWVKRTGYLRKKYSP